MQKTIKTTFEFLLDNDYFTEDELSLCIRGWGDNQKIYDIMCHVRYGMDVDQLLLQFNEDENEHIELSDYKSLLLQDSK